MRRRRALKHFRARSLARSRFGVLLLLADAPLPLIWEGAIVRRFVDSAEIRRNVPAIRGKWRTRGGRSRLGLRVRNFHYERG